MGVVNVILNISITDWRVPKTEVHLADSGYYNVAVRDGAGFLRQQKHEVGTEYLGIKVPVFCSNETCKGWSG